MQDRYAGDVGDFVKLGLLRSLAQNRNLGVIWYRHHDEDHNSDGRHVGYLEKADRYRHLDPDLFDHLNHRVLKSRSISSLLPALNAVTSFEEYCSFMDAPPPLRPKLRETWFQRALKATTACDIVFADPDNGLVDDREDRKRDKKFGKRLPLSEVAALARDRCAIIYHHNTRRKGGHDAEVDHWQKELDMKCLAVRARAYSPRTFFIINPDQELISRINMFCQRWAKLGVGLHQQK